MFYCEIMIGKEAFMNILSVLLCYALYIKNVVYIVSDKKMNSLEGMAERDPNSLKIRVFCFEKIFYWTWYVFSLALYGRLLLFW